MADGPVDRENSLFGGFSGFSGFFALLSQLLSGLFSGQSGGGFFNTLQNLGRNGASWLDDGKPNTLTDNVVTRGFSRIFPRDSQFDSAAALAACRRDDASEGECARGVANLLLQQGFDVTRGHAHDWDKTLKQNDWVKLEGVDPRNAPEGAVLVFDSDKNMGKRPRNTGGGLYGHVEIVALEERTDANGNEQLTRRYVSDTARTNPGGSVPDNYIGAYVTRERYAEIQAAARQMVAENQAPAQTPSAAPSTSTSRTSVAATVDVAAQKWNVPALSSSFSGAGSPDSPAPVQPAGMAPVIRREPALTPD